jgi:hypothetical protein
MILCLGYNTTTACGQLVSDVHRHIEAVDKCPLSGNIRQGMGTSPIVPLPVQRMPELLQLFHYPSRLLTVLATAPMAKADRPTARQPVYIVSVILDALTECSSAICHQHNNFMLIVHQEQF